MVAGNPQFSLEEFSLESFTSKIIAHMKKLFNTYIGLSILKLKGYNLFYKFMTETCHWLHNFIDFDA